MQTTPFRARWLLFVRILTWRVCRHRLYPRDVCESVRGLAQPASPQHRASALLWAGLGAALGWGSVSLWGQVSGSELALALGAEWWL